LRIQYGFGCKTRPFHDVFLETFELVNDFLTISAEILGEITICETSVLHQKPVNLRWVFLKEYALPPECDFYAVYNFLCISEAGRFCLMISNKSVRKSSSLAFLKYATTLSIEPLLYHIVHLLIHFTFDLVIGYDNTVLYRLVRVKFVFEQLAEAFGSG
jgi:hypothetical protein